MWISWTPTMTTRSMASTTPTAASAIGTQIAGAAALGVALPVGGGAVLGFSFLVPKGREVHVPPETQMRIRLRQPLTLRVNW